MDLGRCALRRAVVLVPSLVLMMCVTTACTPSASSSRAGHATPSRARPFTLSRHGAERALAQVVRSLPGLHAKVTRCPGGSGCHGVAGSAWYASAQRVGAGIVHGNGFSASAYVGVVAFRSPRGARRFVHHVRHEHARYNGVFSVALKPGRGGHYQPGERGVGSLAPVHRHGWSGWVLDMQHSYTFWDGSESAEQLTRKFLASRGRYVCAAFLDARSVSELRHYVPAWGRLVAALGG
jgi:hypothetical protein